MPRKEKRGQQGGEGWQKRYVSRRDAAGEGSKQAVTTDPPPLVRSKVKKHGSRCGDNRVVHWDTLGYTDGKGNTGEQFLGYTGTHNKKERRCTVIEGVRLLLMDKGVVF